MNQQHMILKNEGNHFEINAYQVSCPLSLPLYNMSSCRSMLRKIVYINMTALSSNDLKNKHFAKLVVAHEKISQQSW